MVLIFQIIILKTNSTSMDENKVTNKVTQHKREERRKKQLILCLTSFPLRYHIMP